MRNTPSTLTLRRLVEGEDGFLPIRAGMAIDETQQQAALSVLYS